MKQYIAGIPLPPSSSKKKYFGVNLHLSNLVSEYKPFKSDRDAAITYVALHIIVNFKPLYCNFKFYFVRYTTFFGDTSIQFIISYYSTLK